MTERTWLRGSALRFLTTCTVTVALVAACFVTVPPARADEGLNLPDEIPQTPQTGRELVVRRSGGENPNQPLASSNDTCAGADAIPAGVYPVLSTIQNIGANTDAGDPPAPACSAAGNAAQGAAWWSFTPTETNTYFFNTCTAGTTHDDTIVGVYSSSDNTCGGTLTLVGCSDDDNSCPGVPFLSKASALLTSGQTYFVVVWNWAGPPPTADVQIAVTKSLAPGNDTCGGATNLPLNRTVAGTLLSANSDYSFADGACYAGPADNATGVCLGLGRDVVYSFTAPAAGLYSVRVRAVAAGSGNLAIYGSTTCPAAGVIACPGGVVANNKNFTTSAFNAREELSCQALSAGETLYAIVDECAAGVVAGGPIRLEAFPCHPESEPNDTPATASASPFAGVSPVEGAIDPGSDVDFFSLGVPPAGSRVFAHVDTNQLSNFAVPPNPVGADSGDLDLRVTTDTGTLEYDDQDSDQEMGTLAPSIAGRPLTGVPSYLRINQRTGLQAGGKYHVHSTVQPPGFDSYGSSATAESNEGINNDFPGAETAGNNFWAGTLFNSTDIDLFRVCASEGDILLFQADNDPTRSDPIPGRTLVTGFSVLTGGQLGPFSGFNNPGFQASNTTSGAGSLSATTPFSPSEAWLWRAEYNGPHFGYIDMRAAPALVNGQDYFFSATVNGQNGSEMSSDIQLTKTGPDTAAAGDIVVYTVTLTNNGPSTATFASFFDQLPDGTSFAGFGLDGAADLFGFCNSPPLGDVGGSVDCTFECLPAGRTVTIEIAVQVFQCIGDGFTLFNQVFANSFTTMAPESVTFASMLTTIGDDGTCDADGDACTDDTCDAGTCVPVGPANCDDGNACTTDSCDSVTGCVYTNNTDPCDDGSACTSGDVCGDGACQPGGVVDPNDSNPCTDDSCDPLTGVSNVPNTAACDDANACTSGDVCGGGSCQPGAAVDPSDGNVCTDDSCDPLTGVSNVPNTAACSDGSVCTIGDVCGGGSCQSGVSVDPSDGNVCTDDSCDPLTGVANVPNTAPCDDGDASTENDTCSAGVCSGTIACTGGAKPRSKGYYRGLCNNPHSGDELTAADAACVASISATFANVTSVADICAELGPNVPNNDSCEKSEMDLMALALNLCKDKVCESQGINAVCGSASTVGQAFDTADGLLADPGRTTATCNSADCATRGINNGHLLELDTLTLSFVAGEVRLDWEPPLTETPVNSYKVWRRVAGSLAPFTQIGTSSTPHYVDATAAVGQFEYEIQAD